MHQDVRDDMRAWDMLEGVLGCSQYGATANDWKVLLKVFAVQMPGAVEEREVGAVEGREVGAVEGRASYAMKGRESYAMEGRASYTMESRASCAESVETAEGFGVWGK